MFSGGHKLGMPSPEMHIERAWYQADNSDEMESDVDFISAQFLSPDAGYPPQRIANYDVPLALKQELNGGGLGKLPTQARINRFFGTLARTQTGATVRAAGIFPRTARPTRMMHPMGTFIRTR